MALTEAARWYSIAAEHTDGEEHVELLRRTAHHYHSADRPTLAARYFSELSKLVTGKEKDECERMSVALSIRSGRFLSVRDQLDDLAKRLRLPRPKSSIVSMLSITVRVAKLAWKRRHRRSSGIEARDVTETFGIGKGQTVFSELSPHDALQQKRLEMCNQLARPMSMFDSLYSAELNVTAASLVSDYGDDAQRIHVAVGESVYGCYGPGKQRNDGEAILLALSQYVCPKHHPESQADVWAGIASAHTLSCRWEQVDSPLRLAVEAYQSFSSDSSFELAHTQWMGLWSNWHLGRWQKLMIEGESMIADATKRGDLYMQMLTTGGFGAASWLAGDRVDQLQHAMLANEQSEFDNRQMEFFQFFQWMAEIQFACYQGDFKSAWKTFRSSEPALCRYPFRKIQMIRIVRASFGSLIALHCMMDGDASLWSRQVKSRTRQLRQENNSFADLVADLHDGLLYEVLTRNSGKSTHQARAIDLLTRAAKQSEHHRLRPYELAAKDAISRLESQFAEVKVDDVHQAEPAEQLFARMRRHGVACPEKLARLYTLDPEAIR